MADFLKVNIKFVFSEKEFKKRFKTILCEKRCIRMSFQVRKYRIEADARCFPWKIKKKITKYNKTRPI
jgi:hypothetical protein